MKDRRVRSTSIYTWQNTRIVIKKLPPSVVFCSFVMVLELYCRVSTVYKMASTQPIQPKNLYDWHSPSSRTDVIDELIHGVGEFAFRSFEVGTVQHFDISTWLHSDMAMTEHGQSRG